MSSPAASAVRHGLVDNVPSVDNILVAVDYSVDVVAEACIEDFLLHWLALLVLEHPVAELSMPHEAVSAELDAVLTAEVCYLVGALEVPLTLFWMNLAGLHVVLGCDAVKLFLYQVYLSLIGNVALVDCHSKVEVVLVGFLETGWSIVDLTAELCACGAGHEQHEQAC